MNTDKENYCPIAATETSHQPGAEKVSPDGLIRLAKIRELNDRLRCHGQGGMWLVTDGVSSLPKETLRTILSAVEKFHDFNSDNDPHGEHDCAGQKIGDISIIWKIDYYDRGRQFHSPDPASSKVTVRVLTVMLASEY